MTILSHYVCTNDGHDDNELMAWHYDVVLPIVSFQTAMEQDEGAAEPAADPQAAVATEEAQTPMDQWEQDRCHWGHNRKIT